MTQDLHFSKVLLLFFFPAWVQAQELAGFSTIWDDSFAEWHLYIYDEGEEEGKIELTWPMRDDWTQWSFRLGELSGTVKQKWKDDPNLWELRADNEVITIRTVWSNDWRQWVVTNGSVRLDVKSKYGNILEEWSIRDTQLGEMQMYTAWEGDLRDWVIEDRLDDEVSLPTKIALTFIPIFYSTPKF